MTKVGNVTKVVATGVVHTYRFHTQILTVLCLRSMSAISLLFCAHLGDVMLLGGVGLAISVRTCIQRLSPSDIWTTVYHI